ncbi:MAG: hypothetical protein FD158_2077 [bacterium]|nr:MAG: hypothetical protein FD158_2077 [bacterium]
MYDLPVTPQANTSCYHLVEHSPPYLILVSENTKKKAQFALSSDGLML